MDCENLSCKPVDRYTAYFANGFGAIYKNADMMKLEIFARGPIVCSIMSTPLMDDFYGKR